MGGWGTFTRKSASDNRFFGEGLLHAIFEGSEGSGIAGSAKASDIGLSVVLIAVL